MINRFGPAAQLYVILLMAAMIDKLRADGYMWAIGGTRRPE
jgi:hypothetical protein